MNKLKFALQLTILTATTLSALIGCSEPEDRPNPFTVEGSYDVNSVSLECSDPARCTNSLGVVLTVSTTSEEKYGYTLVTTSVSRCTGALYSATQVLTAGHCTSEMGKGKSYFRTVATPGRPSQTFEVRRVLQSHFDSSNLYSGDFASLELIRPAHGYDYVRSAVEISESLTKVTALVVNQPGADTNTFKLDAVDCEVDTATKPMHVAQLPSIWGTKLCKLVSGNSGGPVFAEGALQEVLGVLSRSTEAGSKYGYSLNTYREPESFRNLATFANAACFTLPGWPAPASGCQILTEDSIKKMLGERFSNAIVAAGKNILENHRESPESILNLGPATIKTSLKWITAEKSWSLTEDDALTLIALPIPACLERGTLASGYGSSVKTRVYRAKFAQNPVTLEEVPERFQPWITFSKLASGKWRVNYDFSGAGFSYKLTAKSEALLKYGLEFDLQSCSERDDANP